MTTSSVVLPIGAEALHPGGHPAYHFWSSFRLADRQPADIPVLLDHDPDLRVGSVVHLEEHHGNAVAVAVVDTARIADVDERRHASATTLGRFERRGLLDHHQADALLEEVSLVHVTATLGTPRVEWAHHVDVRRRGDKGGWSLDLPRWAQDALRRACDHSCGYDRHLDVLDVDSADDQASTRPPLLPPPVTATVPRSREGDPLQTVDGGWMRASGINRSTGRRWYDSAPAGYPTHLPTPRPRSPR
jgi:hypothetical protein